MNQKKLLLVLLLAPTLAFSQVTIITSNGRQIEIGQSKNCYLAELTNSPVLRNLFELPERLINTIFHNNRRSTYTNNTRFLPWKSFIDQNRGGIVFAPGKRVIIPNRNLIIERNGNIITIRRKVVRI